MRRFGSVTTGVWVLLCLACVDLTPPGRSPDGPGPRPDVPNGDVPIDPRPDAPRDADAAEDADGDLPPVDLAPDQPLEVAPETPPSDTSEVMPPALKPNGAACPGGAATCLSNFCVDGVCCESVCNSLCYSCNATTPGRCLPVAAGQDPGNDCTAAPIGSCGFDGTCNGMGACRRELAGTTCVAGTCAGSTETASSTCDGAGTCRPGAVRECAPYLCGPTACRTNCATTAGCKSGYACQGNLCVIPATDAGAPEVAPPPTDPILVIDNFSDTSLARNTMGGAVTWDNQSVSLVGGQVRFQYTGSGGYHDFIEAFLGNFCAYDIRMYKTLRFKMRASAARSVRIFLARSNNNCGTAATPLINTVSLTTTLTTYTVDISAAVRDRALFFEWSPVSNDSTEYFLDDIELIP